MNAISNFDSRISREVIAVPPEAIDMPADAFATTEVDRPRPLEIPADADEGTLLGLVELLLKTPDRVHELARVPARQPELVQRFLAIALVSLSFFGIGLAALIATVPPAALPGFMITHCEKHPVVCGAALWAAYTAGFVLAAGVCLPSFYFYALLAGVRVSVLQVTTQIMKGMAATCLILMGILPIYIAVILGEVVFRFDPETLRYAIWLGLGLPLLAGLWGLYSIYRGFLALADTIDECRRANRLCFLRRLTLACTLNYAAVAPVMIYTLWNHIVVAWGA